MVIPAESERRHNKSSVNCGCSANAHIGMRPFLGYTSGSVACQTLKLDWNISTAISGIATTFPVVIIRSDTCEANDTYMSLRCALCFVLITKTLTY